MKKRPKENSPVDVDAPEVLNRQRSVAVDCARFVEFCIEARAAVRECHGQTFTVAFFSDAKMKRLNSEFRGIASTTDVLSFPNLPEGAGERLTSLGDIAISIDQAKRQARSNGLKLDGEIRQLILHGLLHLCGYDHESDNGEMVRYELKLRRKLGI